MSLSFAVDDEQQWLPQVTDLLVRRWWAERGKVLPERATCYLERQAVAGSFWARQHHERWRDWLGHRTLNSHHSAERITEDSTVVRYLKTLEHALLQVFADELREPELLVQEVQLWYQQRLISLCAVDYQVVQGALAVYRQHLLLTGPAYVVGYAVARGTRRAFCYPWYTDFRATQAFFALLRATETSFYLQLDR